MEQPSVKNEPSLFSEDLVSSLHQSEQSRLHKQDVRQECAPSVWSMSKHRSQIETDDHLSHLFTKTCPTRMQISLDERGYTFASCFFISTHTCNLRSSCSWKKNYCRCRSSWFWGYSFICFCFFYSLKDHNALQR